MTIDPTLLMYWIISLPGFLAIGMGIALWMNR